MHRGSRRVSTAMTSDPGSGAWEAGERMGRERELP